VTLELYIALLMQLGQILGPVGYGPVLAVRGQYDVAVEHRIVVIDDTAVEVKVKHSFTL
jgi:hypothetical protein